MKINFEQFETIVVYGIGQYYEKIKDILFQKVKPNYLYDRKWAGSAPDDYDGIPIIKREELYRLEHGLVIITAGVPWMTNSIKSDLEHISGITAIHIDEIIGEQRYMTGKKLKEICMEGCYEDAQGNRIYFDKTIPDSLAVCFQGKQNTLRVGKNVVVNKLMIVFGNRGICRIGDRTEIVDANFIVSEARLLVGADCLISVGVIVRNHDEHHIFDADTHKRVNYSRDVIIDDQVWIGFRASVLAGAKIGKGSIVGEGCVTSGQFGEHQIIAGCPGRVVRERVCWSRDNTYFFNHDILEDCISQDALRYL